MNGESMTATPTTPAEGYLSGTLSGAPTCPTCLTCPMRHPSATGTPNLSQYLLSTLNITIFVGR